MSTKNAQAAVKDTPNEPADANTGLGNVVIRNQFYRDGYRNLVRLCVVLCIANMFLIGAIYFVIHSYQPQDRYFATTEDGRLVPMVPLDQPNLSNPALMSWVAQAATETMTFGFNDYRRRLQESSRNFTRSGWENFTKAIQEAKLIETVEANQQVVSAAPRGAPILISEGLVNGRYQWTVQLPLTLSFQSGSKTQIENYLLRIVIVRRPRLESSSGIGIESWIARAQ